MRYQVPQFIDIEDKIVGPLTLKQFIIYFCTVLLLIPVYLFSDLSLFFTIALPILATAAAFAHFKPGGKSLFVFIGNALKFISETKIWTWRRAPHLKLLPAYGIELESAAVFEDPGLPAGRQVTSSLQQKAQDIETHGNVSKEDLADPITEQQEKMTKA